MSTEQAPRFRGPANWYNSAPIYKPASAPVTVALIPEPQPAPPRIAKVKTIWEAILTLKDADPPPPTVPLNAIKAAVCNYFGIPRLELEGKSQTKRLAAARRLYVILGKRHTKNSIKELGRRINKHHTSMLHALDVIDKHPQDYSQAISEIEAKLGVGK